MTPYTIQNILVPIDLSEPSLNALHTAVALAKKHNAAIHLLYIEESLSSALDTHVDTFVSNQANVDVLMALAGSVKNAHDILPAVIEDEGHVVEKVIKTSLQLQCDLIIMGTHGASGYRDGFIGSNTYNVIKYADCPVLTIPPKRKYTSFKKILFPIRPVAGALQPYSIASQFVAPHSTIEVLGLSYLNIERETGVLDKLVEEIKDGEDMGTLNINTYWAQGHSVANDILQFAQLHHPELIVLTSVLDATPKANFIGPHAQKVINGAKVPVLNIKKVGVPVFN